MHSSACFLALHLHYNHWKARCIYPRVRQPCLVDIYTINIRFAACAYAGIMVTRNLSDGTSSSPWKWGKQTLLWAKDRLIARCTFSKILCSFDVALICQVLRWSFMLTRFILQNLALLLNVWPVLLCGPLDSVVAATCNLPGGISTCCQYTKFSNVG